MFKRQEVYKETDLTDIEIIEGLQNNDEFVEKSFYISCRKYLFNFRSGVFDFNRKGAREPQDIFQDSFLALWQEIQEHRIYVRDNYAWRIDRQGVSRRMSATLITYLMAIAKNKNFENIREEEIYGETTAGLNESIDEHPEENYRRWIVIQCVNKLPNRCKEILTLFYFEKKSLDEIMSIRKENQSKDGLKTGKSKCMKSLKELITKQLELNKLKPLSHVW